MRNAYEIPELRFSAVSGAAVPRHRFVSIDANGNGIVNDGQKAIVGVSMNQCDKADEVLEIAKGIVVVEAAGAVSAGNVVKADASGKAIVGTGLTGMTAITGSDAAGDLISVLL